MPQKSPSHLLLRCTISSWHASLLIIQDRKLRLLFSLHTNPVTFNLIAKCLPCFLPNPFAAALVQAFINSHSDYCDKIQQFHSLWTPPSWPQPVFPAYLSLYSFTGWSSHHQSLQPSLKTALSALFQGCLNTSEAHINNQLPWWSKLFPQKIRAQQKVLISGFGFQTSVQNQRMPDSLDRDKGPSFQVCLAGNFQKERLADNTT